jgi:hypothetical protein
MRDEWPERVDLAWQDDELERAAGALLDGELTPAFDLLASTRGQSDRRELCVDVLGQAGSLGLPALRAAVEQRRDDAERLLLWGSALRTAAWEARGTAIAERTGNEQIGQLIDLTRQARVALRKAAELAPADPVPWSLLMACTLGVPEHDDEGDQVFAEVQRRAENLFGAGELRLQMLAAKWYGSNEAVLDFARTQTGDLPPGHPNLALVPQAHIEVQLDNLSTGSIFKRIWRSMTYLGKEHVRAEVNAASDRLLAAAETYRAHPRSPIAHQTFATLYHQADDDLSSKAADRGRLARHLAYSGTRPARWPWGYFGDHAEQFGTAHKTAADFK